MTEMTPPPDLDDPALGRAFGVAFRDHYSLILMAAYNRVNDREAAEDAVEEVFTAAWRRRAEHERVFTLPWLYTTLRHVVGNEYRRRTREVRRGQKLAGVADPTAESSDDALEVRAAVMTLPLADRELIWMAYWEDLTREEMAAILGCSLSALKVRLVRARRRLETRLQGGTALVIRLHPKAEGGRDERA